MTSPMTVPLEFLKEFENGLNPRFPERSPIPARILGYGEIGTTLEIAGYEGVACKRFPMFYSEEETIAYQALHDAYVHTLREAGLNVVPSETARLEHRGAGSSTSSRRNFPPIPLATRPFTFWLRKGCDGWWFRWSQSYGRSSRSTVSIGESGK